MRAILQRVTSSTVKVDGDTVGTIGKGWLILLGVGEGDDVQDVDYLAKKVLELRAFPDAEQKMNLSVQDIEGEILVVSQFTLYGDCRKGRRPSFSKAASGDASKLLYETFVERIRLSNIRVATGKFQADMKVELTNDGPVTFLLDSSKQF